ncbi:MAG: metallophosphatase [Tissierellia bacterium]|nr:metallophosphatase [Tissierellia bacterium]
MKEIKIFLEEGQNVFFTSDLHLGHENVISFCKRPFKSVGQMNQQLIEKWNNTVKPQDIVFQLGDFIWRGKSGQIPEIQSELSGKIYNIQGNHDKHSYFGSSDYYDIITLKIKDGVDIFKFILSHYPLMTWAGRDKGIINIHGHLHLFPDMDKPHSDHHLPLHPNQYDAGVDNNEYKPVDYKTILKKTNYGMGN